jgi:integrase
MGRKHSPGLRKRRGIWHIEKQIRGYGRLYESTGAGQLQEAERYLAKRVEEIRENLVYGKRPARSFREAATKYLLDNQDKASIGKDACHLKQLDPFIGDLPMHQVHMGTLAPFIAARRQQGVKTKTINLALSTVRRILNLAARLWRDEQGLSWLETAPLIQMLPIYDAREPYPLSWDEQARLFRELPPHLERMALFKVNTGTREQEVCQLRWEWEVPIAELGRSVFVIPRQLVKNREDRLVVLNDVAWRVVNERRGADPQFVFTYRGHVVKAMNNSAWVTARTRCGLPQVRVHDLKHTFGRRLRAAGVSLETRKVLLGHRNGDITTHYSAPELQELLDAANKVCLKKSGKIPALTLIRTTQSSG